MSASTDPTDCIETGKRNIHGQTWPVSRCTKCDAEFLCEPDRVVHNHGCPHIAVDCSCAKCEDAR